MQCSVSGLVRPQKCTKGGESLGDEESSKEEEEVVPALILASGARPLAPDVKSHLSYSERHIASRLYEQDPVHISIDRG